MGQYVNPSGENFKKIRNSEIYVDKSDILKYINAIIDTNDRYICISRPRRFGKTMTVNLLSAYYCKDTDADMLFSQLKYTNDAKFHTYANKYNVIKLTMSRFFNKKMDDIDSSFELLEKCIINDLSKIYPDFDYSTYSTLDSILYAIYEKTGIAFVFIIDEWDAIFRTYPEKSLAQEKYLDYLQIILKDQEYVALAYMTGILPIKKYSSESSLNMFKEYTMTDPGVFAPFIGFTDEEVKELCSEHAVDYEECKLWYDGYSFDSIGSIYNPGSVVQCIQSNKFKTYWTQTGTYELLETYIKINDAIYTDIMALLSNEKKRIDISKFSNNLTSFKNNDDVLTVLIHLGYLGYSENTQEVFIPNYELYTEFSKIVLGENWTVIHRAIHKSNKLLKDTLAKNAKAVAQAIQDAHLETSHLQYNDENALSYTISLAYYTAKEHYTFIREFPSGKGFADLLLLPKFPSLGNKALLIELKWDKDAKTAIDQIKERQYTKNIETYKGNILLVGISYDKRTKEHTCILEEFQKDR